MKNTLKAISSVLLACSVNVAMAQEFYSSWPRIELGKIKWFIDEESLTKVGNTVFFDSFMNTDTKATLSYETATRVGFTCDGNSYVQIAQPWAQDEGESMRGGLKSSLDLNRSIELNPQFVTIKRAEKTQTLTSLLATLCKTRKRADRDLMMVVAKSTEEVSVARLSTYQRINASQVEAWVDNVNLSTFAMLTFRSGEWAPALNEDGSAKRQETMGTNRKTVYKRRFDCERNRAVVISYNEYDDKGNSKDSFVQPNPIPESKWREVIPGTVGEGVLTMLCAL